MKNIRKSVFFISVFVLLLAVVANIISPQLFLSAMEQLNAKIGEHFGWFYSVVALFLVVCCVYVYFSPLGDKKVGGENAKPLLNRWNWFAITLCTTIAAGILFWSAAEPIYHITQPPSFLNIEPNSYSASLFSMSTMFLHWGITPYAIYCAPALLFAFVHYNLKMPYSFNSCFVPLIGEKHIEKTAFSVDALCLFVTGAGLSASLGMGILSISGGLTQAFGLESSPKLWVIVGITVVVCFVISSASGLMRGIKMLSTYNTYIFIALLVFAFLLGPTSFICNYGVESFGSYIATFFERSLMVGATSSDNWSKAWTVQYFASWLAWAPMTALFLGKISYGHKYKDFILFNLVLPSIFSMVWVAILGGNSIFRHLYSEDMLVFINNFGLESVLYKVFEYLPLAKITIPILVATVFLSFVTAADSTTNAMANLCVKSSDKIGFEPPIAIKIIWGVLIGSISLIMITGKGISGVKILSTIAGFPATLLLFFVGISLIKVAKAPDKLININKNQKGNLK